MVSSSNPRVPPVLSTMRWPKFSSVARSLARVSRYSCPTGASTLLVWNSLAAAKPSPAIDDWRAFSIPTRANSCLRASCSGSATMPLGAYLTSGKGCVSVGAGIVGVSTRGAGGSIGAGPPAFLASSWAWKSAYDTRGLPAIAGSTRGASAALGAVPKAVSTLSAPPTTPR